MKKLLVFIVLMLGFNIGYSNAASLDVTGQQFEQSTVEFIDFNNQQAIISFNYLNVTCVEAVCRSGPEVLNTLTKTRENKNLLILGLNNVGANFCNECIKPSYKVIIKKCSDLKRQVEKNFGKHSGKLLLV
jgi:hypothetical protein